MLMTRNDRFQIVAELIIKRDSRTVIFRSTDRLRECPNSHRSLRHTHHRHRASTIIDPYFFPRPHLCHHTSKVTRRLSLGHRNDRHDAS